MTYTPYFFGRNRDLGTISVYVGYRDVRCVPPIYIYGLPRAFNQQHLARIRERNHSERLAKPYYIERQ